MDYFYWPEFDGQQQCEWIIEWFDIYAGKNRADTLWGGNLYIRTLITFVYSNLPIMRLERKR